MPTTKYALGTIVNVPLPNIPTPAVIVAVHRHQRIILPPTGHTKFADVDSSSLSVEVEYTYDVLPVKAPANTDSVVMGVKVP